MEKAVVKDIELPKDDSKRSDFIMGLSRQDQVSVLSKLTRDERMLCVVNDVAYGTKHDQSMKELFEAFNFKQTGVVVMGGAIDTIEQGRNWVPRGALSIEKPEEGVIETWT